MDDLKRLLQKQTVHELKEFRKSASIMQAKSLVKLIEQIIEEKQKQDESKRFSTRITV